MSAIAGSSEHATGHVAAPRAAPRTASWNAPWTARGPGSSRRGGRAGAGPSASAAGGRKPRRILHLSKHCMLGNGSVHAAIDLACLQAASGDEVVFASGGGTYVDFLAQHGVRHWLLPQDQSRPGAMLRSAARLAAFCVRARTDVLHAHMMGGAALGYAASRLSGLPLVTTVHNSFDGHSGLMRLGDRAVAVSHAEREQLLRRGWNPDRVKVVWNAPVQSPRLEVIRNDHPVVLEGPSIAAVCGLHRRKGLTDLIEACATTFPLHPGWRLYIAGEGPDREALEAMVAARGLSDRVVFLGYVANPVPIYQQADIFVLASLADPGSLSIGEARAAGRAIVATAVGGTPEMLAHGEAGRLVPPSDPAALAAALDALMSDDAARAALGRRAREGSEVFGVARLHADYDAIYADALAARRRDL